MCNPFFPVSNSQICTWIQSERMPCRIASSCIVYARVNFSVPTVVQQLQLQSIVEAVKISKIIEKAQLVPQKIPIVAFDKKYVHEKPIILTLARDGFHNQSYKYSIKNLINNQRVFEMLGHTVVMLKETLYDVTDNHPISNFKQALMKIRFGINVYHGGDSDNFLCQFDFNAEFSGIKVKGTFINQENNEKVHLVMVGDNRFQNAMVFIGDPEKGGEAIMRICRGLPTDYQGSDLEFKGYVLEVAPGVDISMMVTFCLSVLQYRSFNIGKKRMGPR
ncbi:hypothetical protein BC833DRAFT_662928 [Globomyces pollinis-pini]|nr:hypothetical protein BC833DRAFT_662928 [Globomyces pollinis-pini]